VTGRQCSSNQTAAGTEAKWCAFVLPAVLDTLKGNADQLFQLKQEVVAEKQVRLLDLQVRAFLLPWPLPTTSSTSHMRRKQHTNAAAVD
jgi:hypothetical protein